MATLSPEYIADFLQYVRDRSAYYGGLWSEVPVGVSSVDQLPLTDLDTYWKAAKENKLPTKGLFDGSVFRTGGTTSEPKVVYIARDEMAESLPPTAAA